MRELRAAQEELIRRLRQEGYIVTFEFLPVGSVPETLLVYFSADDFAAHRDRPAARIEFEGITSLLQVTLYGAAQQQPDRTERYAASEVGQIVGDLYRCRQQNFK